VTAKRAAVYARVSTAEQVDGTSLGTQVERCEHYIAAQDWTAAGRYVDEGVSGAKASRPALDQLLVAVRAGSLDAVVVSKLDRIGRSMRHLGALLGELDDRNVGLVSVSEAFDSSTASGRLQRNMLGSFAEFERELIRDRMISGRDAAVRAGRWASAQAPYGYRVGHDQQLEIDPAEAEAIGLLVDLFVNHCLSTPAIAVALNERGFRPRRAAAWTASLVRWTLRESDHLSGGFVWGRAGRGYKGQSISVAGPAVVDPATHERLRARVAETANAHTSHPGRYLLSGRVTSPHGTPMYGYCTNTPVYRCAHTFAKTAPPEGRSCTCRTVRAEAVESAVWVEVTALLTDPGRLLAMAGVHLDRQSNAQSSNEDDLAAVDRKISRLERAAGERLSRLLADGVDPVVVAHASRTLTKELTVTRARRQRLLGWQATNLERQNRTAILLEIAEQAKLTLPDADRETKARVFALLDVNVRVLGWGKCPTCAGTGWIPKWPTGQAPRITDGVRSQFGGLVCPECHRHRWLPKLVIEGTVPETDLHDHSGLDDAERWPFTLIGDAG
jgi:site-specific DNA recombinase